MVAGFLGAVAGLGILLVVAGLRGVPAGTLGSAAQRWSPNVDRLSLRLGLALGAAVVVYAVTRWPVGAVAGAVFGFTAPTLLGARARRRREVERIEAVARWAEQLRDTMSAAAGLHEAIGVTARVAPLPIRTEVQELAARLRQAPLPGALRCFASQLACPAGDQVAVALILASERHGARLSDVLSRVAAASRAEASLRLRIEAQRRPHVQPGSPRLGSDRRGRRRVRRSQPCLSRPLQHSCRPGGAGPGVHPLVRIVLGAGTPGGGGAGRADPVPGGDR